MEFGVIVPQGWRLELEGEGPNADIWEAARAVALKCERLGFSSIWLYDHLIPRPPPTSDPCLECWTTLAALATLTSRVRLGQIVTCNSYRNPALLAKMAATLDNISGGRLEFGIGAGWYREEYEAYGFEYPGAPERIAMLEEAVQVIKALWTLEKASFAGRHYRLNNAACSPKPTQKPHPPITVGGVGRKRTLRVVAKHADACNLFGPPREFQSGLEALRRHCLAVGRRFEAVRKSITLDVLIASSESRALEKMERFHPRLGPHLPVEALRERGLVGDPPAIQARLRQYAGLGAEYFILYFPDAHSSDSLELFAHEVMNSLLQR